MNKIIHEPENQLFKWIKLLSSKALVWLAFMLVAGLLFTYFDNQGAAFFYTGHPKDALAPTQQALAVQEAQLGHEHPEVANTMKNLARVYDANGEYAKAEPLYKNSIAVYQRTLGKTHADYATALCFYGDHLFTTNKYADAEDKYKEALTVYVKATGPKSKEVAWTWQRLRNLYSKMGRYQDSEKANHFAEAILNSGS